MSKKKQWLLIGILVIIFILCGLMGKLLYDITSQDEADNEEVYMDLGKVYYEKLAEFLNSNSDSKKTLCNVDISDSFCQMEDMLNTNYQECLDNGSVIYSSSITYHSMDDLISSLESLFIDNIIDSYMLDEGVNFIEKDNKLYCLATSTKSNYLIYGDDYDIISYNQDGSSIEYLISASYYESNNIDSIKYRSIHLTLQKYNDSYKISYYGLS